MEVSIMDLPNEVLLKILTLVSQDTDSILSSICLVNQHFCNLSQDTSLWKSFSCPQHWPEKVFVRFLKHHPVAMHIQTLYVPEYMMKSAEHVLDGLNLPGLRRLVFTPEVPTRIETKNTSRQDQLQKPNKYLLLLIMQMFPNLKCLNVRSCMIPSIDGVNQFYRVYPNLEIDVTLSSDSNEFKSMFSSQKLRIATAKIRTLASFEWMLANVDARTDCTLDITIPYKEFLERGNLNWSVNIQGFAQHFRHHIREITIGSGTHTNDLILLSNICLELKILALGGTKGILTAASLTAMPNLEDLTLRSTSVENMQPILDASPNLRSLSLSSLGESSAQLSTTLPVKLRSLTLHRLTGFEVLKDVLLASQHCPLLEELKGGQVFTTVLAFLHRNQHLTKPWRHLQTFEYWFFKSRIDDDEDNFQAVLKHLSCSKSSLRSLQIGGNCAVEHLTPVMQSLAQFTTLKEVALEPVFKNDLQVEDIRVLVSSCPHLHCLTAGTLAILKVDFVPTLMSVLAVIRGLKMLRSLQLGLNYTTSVEEDDEKDAEEQLNAEYRPWLSVTVSRSCVFVQQCPPVYRR